MTWRDALVVVAVAATRGRLRPPDRRHRDLARRQAREGGADRGRLPAGRAVRPHRREPGQADGAGAPPAMLSKPEGCSDGLTRVIADSAERGPGSAAEYLRRLRRRADGDDGADVAAGPRQVGRHRRSVRQVRDFLRSVGPRHSDDHHEAADPARRRAGVRADHAVERHAESSVYFSFENVGETAVFGIAFPTAESVDPRQRFAAADVSGYRGEAGRPRAIGLTSG